MSHPETIDPVVEQIAEVMRDITALCGNCTEADLIAAGFAPGEIEKHKAGAAQLAASRWRGNANRVHACSPALIALKQEVRALEAAGLHIAAQAQRIAAGLTPARICPVASPVPGGGA